MDATLCRCHHAPTGDGATLCTDGTLELVDLLRWLTPDVMRADREPPRIPTQRRLPDGSTLTVDVIAPGHAGRYPSTIWDTPTGEGRHLMRVLDESAARLARRTTHAKIATMRTENPLPGDLTAGNTATRIRACIGTYAALHSGRRIHPDTPWDVPTVASWLLDDIQAVRQQDWAYRFLAELRRLVGKAVTQVDAAPVRHYLGVCGAAIPSEDAPGAGAVAPQDAPGEPAQTSECPGHVFSIDDAPQGACNRCGALHNVRERQDARVAQLEGVRLEAADIERVTTELGRRVSRKRITTWHRRGQIARDDAGYLVQDALRLAEKDAHRRGKASSSGGPGKPVGDAAREADAEAQPIPA